MNRGSSSQGRSGGSFRMATCWYASTACSTCRGWEEVSDCDWLDDRRPGVDPEVAVRLMLAGLLTGIVHDRKLMREVQVNIAIRSFIGYRLLENLPHRSDAHPRALGR